MREELLKMLREKAYRKGEFKLSSGQTSEHYVNCKPVTLHCRGLFYVSCMMLEFLEDDVAAVGGLTLGADPLVSGVAMAAAMDERTVDGLIVRKEAKGHGTQAWIEGPLPPVGSKVVVLEDVVTTGASSLKAVEKLREHGYVVTEVITVVDRKEYGNTDDLWTDNGLTLKSLYEIGDFDEDN